MHSMNLTVLVKEAHRGNPPTSVAHAVQLFTLNARGPVHGGKFMVGRFGQFTLQPMANTNHKFPMTRAMGVPCEGK